VRTRTHARVCVRVGERERESARARALGGLTEAGGRGPFLLVEGEVVDGEGHAVVALGARALRHAVKGEGRKHVPLAALEAKPGEVGRQRVQRIAALCATSTRASVAPPPLLLSINGARDATRTPRRGSTQADTCGEEKGGVNTSASSWPRTEEPSCTGRACSASVCGRRQPPHSVFFGRPATMPRNTTQCNDPSTTRHRWVSRCARTLCVTTGKGLMGAVPGTRVTSLCREQR
jgi:hypothetical protein